MIIHWPSQLVVIAVLLLASGGALLGGGIGDACRALLRGAGYAVLSVLAIAGAMWVTLAGGGAAGGGAVLLGAIGIGLIAGAMFRRTKATAVK